MMEKSKEIKASETNLNNGVSRSVSQVERENSLPSPTTLKELKKIDPDLYDKVKDAFIKHTNADIRLKNANSELMEKNAYKIKVVLMKIK